MADSTDCKSGIKLGPQPQTPFVSMNVPKGPLGVDSTGEPDTGGSPECKSPTF